MDIYYDPLFLEHRHIPGHPESPSRLISIVKGLEESPLSFRFLKGSAASAEQLGTVHSHSYIDGIRQWRIRYLDQETPVYPSTYSISAMAAGCAISATLHSIESGGCVMALIRPPGHHSGRDYGGGFCYFNNAAVAARNCGQSRCAIVDIDVHHGNGTSDIFYGERNVLYISTHQSGIYPGTGEAREIGSGEGEYFNLNLPLPSGSGDSTFDFAFDSVIMPVLREYSPGVIIVSLGIDAHYLDPLASLTLSTGGYVKCISRLASLGPPLSIVLEGGYNPDALSDVVCGLVAGVCGEPYNTRFDVVHDRKGVGIGWVRSSLDIFSSHWRL